jgi:hypothetical protein
MLMRNRKNHLSIKLSRMDLFPVVRVIIHIALAAVYG